jgi:hypothetical protein
MTYQTQNPVREVSILVSARAWGDLIHQLQKGDVTYDLPYQRGDVWSYEQRILLIYSILSGTPVPSLIINDRPDRMWYGPDGKMDQPAYAVIDGKQRITTVRMFMEDGLLVPASWFPAERIEATESTDDGPYVRWSGLSRPAQRFFENKPVPVGEAHVGSVRAEAQIYLRVNGTGTPQDAADIDRAAGIAGTAA